MNTRLLEAIDRQQYRAVYLAYWQHPRWSAWELGKLLDLDENTVKHHLRLITRERAA